MNSIVIIGASSGIGKEVAKILIFKGLESRIRL
jgi:short-subunit dehydrogenase